MEALIFDHVRTPRGKGKPDGALHEVTPVWLRSSEERTFTLVCEPLTRFNPLNCAAPTVDSICLVSASMSVWILLRSTWR